MTLRADIAVALVQCEEPDCRCAHCDDDVEGLAVYLLADGRVACSAMCLRTLLHRDGHRADWWPTAVRA